MAYGPQTTCSLKREVPLQPSSTPGLPAAPWRHHRAWEVVRVLELRPARKAGMLRDLSVCVRVRVVGDRPRDGKVASSVRHTNPTAQHRLGLWEAWNHGFLPFFFIFH